MSEELLRWIGASGCCFILGLNAAFLVRTKNFLWRWFIIGKGLLTLYIGLDIWYDEFHWIIVFALVGIVITSFTQIRAWYLGLKLFS